MENKAYLQQHKVFFHNLEFLGGPTDQILKATNFQDTRKKTTPRLSETSNSLNC